MERMQQVLGEFVEHDLPFLPEERQSRLARLSKHLERPGISDGERFQQLLEAYQVELEYGRTIEAYQGTRQEDSEDRAETRTLAYFRLGRTGLYSLSLDGLQGAVCAQAVRQGFDQALAKMGVRDRHAKETIQKAIAEVKGTRDISSFMAQPAKHTQPQQTRRWQQSRDWSDAYEEFKVIVKVSDLFFLDPK